MSTLLGAGERSFADSDVHLLHRAALLALRGHGLVEPNPMVGCIITDLRGAVIGMGHHERFGGPHAEIQALRSAGVRARGGTMYVTLEPCAHQGKTPPCADAIIAAGVARVVIAQRDPTSVASGGSERLRAAGIEVAFDDSSALANDVSAPFRRREQSGLPWVIAKWAQTLDGRIATESDEPRWISNESSRRMVHRERGRVEAILTGIGTILTDDPLLTVRGVSHRRAPRRIILDPTCRIMQSHQVIETAQEYPTTIVCNTDALTATDRQWLLARKDVDVVAFGASERLPLRVVLSDLARRYEITNLLVEAGEGVLRSLFSERLVNQAWVFVGGGAASPDEAVASAHTFLRRLDEAADRVTLQSARRRRDDLVLLFRHEQPRANWRE